MEHLVAPAINLLILVGLMVYFVRQPVKDSVAQRHAQLRDDLHNVREQLVAAQAKFNEFGAKLRSMDAEIAALKEQARQDAQATKANLLSEARRLSATIVSDSRTTAQNLFSDLRGQLYAEFGNQVLERAEALLRDRLTGDDRAKIRQDFSRQLESVQ